MSEDLKVIAPKEMTVLLGVPIAWKKGRAYCGNCGARRYLTQKALPIRDQGVRAVMVCGNCGNIGE